MQGTKDSTNHGMYSIGIDTGGTFTDAVLVADDAECCTVIAAAKAPTSRHDLSIGIDEAIGRVLAASAVAPRDIELVSLSTTLATNAAVEDRGGRIALVFIGFDEADATRQGLDTALRGDPVIHLRGGHDSLGRQRHELDLDALAQAVERLADSVSGFAITGHFATRNPSHERAAAERIRQLSSVPVTCSHELSARLDGPRRALTCVLNARLIGLIAQLIDAVTTTMATYGIAAPLMIVRGDGSLMSAELALDRPVETILSGPAASLVGAAFLAGGGDAIVSDVGGTTTDIAVMIDGEPLLDPDGARIGMHRTMVNAVAMHTIGLGGDSEVAVDHHTLGGGIAVGPRRVVPVCSAATSFPAIVHQALARQAASEMPSELDACFVIGQADAGASRQGLDDEDVAMLAAIGDGIRPLDLVVRGTSGRRRVARLVQRGLLVRCGFTPTDAAHVLAMDDRFDVAAATIAANLTARLRTPTSKPIAVDGAALAAMVIDALRRRSGEHILDVALRRDDLGVRDAGADALIGASFRGHRGLVEVNVGLSVPVIGLGAAAGLHYPAIAALLHTAAIVPEHADVANAVGAVVGRIRVAQQVTISVPERDRYIIHHPAATAEFQEIGAALAAATLLVSDDARSLARRSGADDAEVRVSERVQQIELAGLPYVVEAVVTAIASGRATRRHDQPSASRNGAP